MTTESEFVKFMAARLVWLGHPFYKARDLAAQYLADWLSDEGIEFGQEDWDWSAEAARDLVDELETE